MQDILNYFKKIPDGHINIFSFLLAVLSILFVFSSLPFINIFWIAIALANIIFWLEGRFSFFFALIFLICTMVSVILKEDKLAENFAILVYYLLLTGVGIEFLQMGVEKLNTKYDLPSKTKKHSANFQKVFITVFRFFREVTKYRIKIYKIDDK